MASSKVKQISDSDFSATISSSTPCLVDFWAPWCGPCKAIGPIIDDLAEEFSGKAIIAKMNVDDNPSTPGKYGIRAILVLPANRNWLNSSTRACKSWSNDPSICEQSNYFQ